MTKLADIFWRNVFLFDNLRNWLLTILKFVMSVHYFACGLLLIHRIKEELGYVTFAYNYNDDGSVNLIEFLTEGEAASLDDVGDLNVGDGDDDEVGGKIQA